MEAKRSQPNDQQQNSLHYQFNGFRDQSIPKAPSTLLESLDARIAQRKSDLATPVSTEQLQQALHDERWDVRCTAIERFGMQDTTEAYTVLARALHDEHRFVRMAALHALAHRETATSRSLLAHGLHDYDWQVREVAVQVIGNYRSQYALEMIKASLDDKTIEVREAAKIALQQYETYHGLQEQGIEIQSITPIQKEECYSMQLNQQSTPISQGIATPVATKIDPLQPFVPLRKKMTRRPYLLALAATLALVIGVLTAAGYSWWNYQMGDPSLYTSVNQQQTSNGVTIKVTKVYADDGHTIIAYDVPIVGQNTFYTLNDWELTGSAPQNKDALSLSQKITYGNGHTDPSNQSVAHRYMVEPQFLVPNGVNQLTIHFTITKLAYSQVGTHTLKTLQGNWDFTFTVPFHHTNDTHIPSPIE